MTQQEYEQKKRECWEECAAQVAVETENLLCKAISYTTFDRAYTLGKIDGAKEQKERDDHYIEMQKAFTRFDKACDGTIYALDKLTNTLDKL